MTDELSQRTRPPGTTLYAQWRNAVEDAPAWQDLPTAQRVSFASLERRLALTSALRSLIAAPRIQGLVDDATHNKCIISDIASEELRNV